MLAENGREAAGVLEAVNPCPGGWTGYEPGQAEVWKADEHGPKEVWISSDRTSPPIVVPATAGSAPGITTERGVRSDIPQSRAAGPPVPLALPVSLLQCGPRLEALDWLEPKSGFTRRIMEDVGRLCRVPINHVAERFGLDWHTVKAGNWAWPTAAATTSSSKPRHLSRRFKVNQKSGPRGPAVLEDSYG